MSWWLTDSPCTFRQDISHWLPARMQLWMCSPHPVPVLGAVQQWSVLTWCRVQCYLGGCNHGSLSLQKPPGSSSPPFDQILLCDVQREELHRAHCLQMLGSSAAKEEQEVIPTNICPSLLHEILVCTEPKPDFPLWQLRAGHWCRKLVMPSPVSKPIAMSYSALQNQSSHLSAQELGIVFYLRNSEYGSSRNHVFQTISYFWKKTVNSSSM